MIHKKSKSLSESLQRMKKKKIITLLISSKAHSKTPFLNWVKFLSKNVLDIPLLKYNRPFINGIEKSGWMNKCT